MYVSKLNIVERFESKYFTEPNTGCWFWFGSAKSNGYGRFFLTQNSKRVFLCAHRFSYELHKGKIPEGLTIDHLCRNPSCVNPDHLEPVTMRENVLRGFGHCGNNARKTHCVNGHELVEANLYRTKDGGRICKTCVKERDKLRKRAA